MAHSTDDPADEAAAAADSELRLDEVQLLLSQLLCELRKMDESLKVMAVYLDRVAGALPRNTTIH